MPFLREHIAFLSGGRTAASRSSGPLGTSGRTNPFFGDVANFSSCKVRKFESSPTKIIRLTERSDFQGSNSLIHSFSGCGEWRIRL
jgi:hypothetical protein